MTYETEFEILGIVIGYVAGFVTPILIHLAKKMIEPVFGIREQISKIVYSMNLNANIISSPANDARHLKVSDELRVLASELLSKLVLVKSPQIPAFFRLMPSRANIEQASRELIGIHNMMLDSTRVVDIAHSSEKLARLLKL